MPVRVFLFNIIVAKWHKIVVLANIQKHLLRLGIQPLNKQMRLAFVLAVKTPIAHPQNDMNYLF